MTHYASTSLRVTLICLVTIAACQGGEEEHGVFVIQEGGTLPDPAAADQPAADEPGEVTESSAQPGGDAPEGMPHDRSLPDPTRATVGAGGGELAAGDYRVVIPGVDDETEAEWLPIAEVDVLQPRPLSTILAAAELRPFYQLTDGMMQITFPLDRPIERGTRLQLLSHNRSMDAFFVVDENTPSDDGTVTFRTDMFSQYVVIAAPRLAHTDCEGSPMAIRQRIPNRQEGNAVGQVARDMRMDREAAFAVLADMRFVDGAHTIVFKNEERRHNPPQFTDEDFLVDPRLVGPLVDLGHNTLTQWIDPIGGGPAFQLRVTDAYDSMIEHSPTSNHYRGRAVDLTMSPIPAANPQTRARLYGQLSRLAVCAGFDFVHFENRHHVHVSSRETRVAWIEDRSDGSTRLVSTGLDGVNRLEQSALMGYPLASIQVQDLSFTPDGSLELTGTLYGQVRTFRVNMRQSVATPLTSPSPVSGPLSQVTVGPTLLLEANYGHLFYRRPSPPLAVGVSHEPPPLAPFALTSNQVHGRLPTVWVGN